MAIDSKAKGSKAEADAAKFLNEKTGLKFIRTPLSGALDAKHGLKGDIYLGASSNKYCIEIKHYEEDHLTSKILTDKTPQIVTWLEQTFREATQVSREPLLIFKHNRGKWFVAFTSAPSCEDYRYAFINLVDYQVFVAKLEDWLHYEKPTFI
jgi:Holliday junction resolvase